MLVSIPCGTKFLRESLFADWRFFAFCGNKFLRLGQIGFSEFLRFSESTQYQALVIFSLLLSTYNKNTFFKKQYYGMGILFKTSNSLCAVLFLNERGNL